MSEPVAFRSSPAKASSIGLPQHEKADHVRGEHGDRDELEQRHRGDRREP